MLQEIRLLIKLSLPIAFMQMLMTTFGLVDTMFLGRLGSESLAGAGLGHAVIAIFMLFGMGIIMGIDPLAAKAFGRGQLKKSANYLLHTQLLALVIALVFIFIIQFYDRRIFEAIGVNPAVIPRADLYMSLASFSLLFQFQFVACRHYLQSMHIANVLVLILILANLFNALADYVFIFGNFGMPKLGVTGAAIATIIATFITAFGAWIVSVKAMRRSGFVLSDWRFHRKIMYRLLAVGIPSGFQILLEVGVFTTVTAFIGQFETQVIAAHQIVLNLSSFTFMFPLGVSFATAVIVGNHFGAREPKRAAMATNLALLTSTIVMCFTCTLFMLIPSMLMQIYTQEAEVIKMGASLLFIAGIFQVCDGIQAIYTGALRGLGKTQTTMMAHAAGHWFVGFPVGCYLAYVRDWQARGFWVGLCVGLISVAIFLGVFWQLNLRKLLHGRM